MSEDAQAKAALARALIASYGHYRHEGTAKRSVVRARDVMMHLAEEGFVIRRARVGCCDWHEHS